MMKYIFVSVNHSIREILKYKWDSFTTTAILCRFCRDNCLEEFNALWVCISLWYFYSNKSYEKVTKSVSNAHRKTCYKPLLPGCVSYKYILLPKFSLLVYEKTMV